MSGDMSAGLWDVEGAAPLLSVMPNHTEFVTTVDFSYRDAMYALSHRLFASGGWDKSVYSYRMKMK